MAAGIIFGGLAGVLGIVGDVITKLLDFIKSAITWYIYIVPGAVKILMFLFFMLFASFIEPSILNTFGNHCDLDGNLYRVPATEIYANIRYTQTISSLRDELQGNLTLREPPFICIGVPGKPITPLCTNCSINATFIGTGFIGDFKCLSDGYRKDEDGLNSTNYNLFSPTMNFVSGMGIHTLLGGDLGNCFILKCAPPKGFFFNHTSEKFQKYTNASAEIKSALEFADPVSPVSESEQYKIENLISVKCENTEPRWYLFSVLKLMNYQLWALLILFYGVIKVRSLLFS